MRSLLQFLALAFVALTVADASATVLVETRSVGAAAVTGVRSTSSADLVLLGAGFNAGLRQGMVCQVARADRQVGEILVVDLRPDAATALILKLAPGAAIRTGDLASAKTI